MAPVRPDLSDAQGKETNKIPVYLDVCYVYRSAMSTGLSTHAHGGEPSTLHRCQTVLIRELRCAVWACGACAAQGDISRVTWVAGLARS